MKRNILQCSSILVLLISIFSSCNNSNDQAVTFQDNTSRAMNADKNTEIFFETAEHDFGVVTEGEKLQYSYIFENKGDKPLLISDVISPCGCTVPSYDKQPILPGQKGKVDIEFNTQGRLGQQSKTLTVRANVPEEEVKISFKATVNAQ